jgi:pimeloyl-ACP methyl ester carboxylesterase
MKFLADVEAACAVLVNCPEYVRSWIDAEQGGGWDNWSKPRGGGVSRATKTRRAVFGVLPIIALVLGYQEVSMSQAKANGGIKNVVLVHGKFVDGSGWQRVYDTLKKDGYTVSIVQNPTISLADDVAVTKRTLAAQDGPAILVGHSYGGVVITVRPDSR